MAEPPVPEHPVLGTAGSAMVLAGPLAAVLVWHWWPLVLALLVFVGTAAAAAVIEASQRQR